MYYNKNDQKKNKKKKKKKIKINNNNSFLTIISTINFYLLKVTGLLKINSGFPQCTMEC